MREHVSREKKTTTGFSIPSLKHPIHGFGLESSAISRQAVTEIQPLHKPLTHDISRIPLRSQAKLSISQPGDIYEQEADSVAQQVMQRMAQPVNRQSIQREALPMEEEELQMKPLANSITPLVQREALPMDKEELQMKPMVQRQAGMAAAPDLETSINQARGGGQVIADNIREPMEVAFGADFSGVKVHTDGQSDQLNRSIQARAFTTGQDVFFRQGEYNPGSRGGQELLAHELTHVVQQNSGAVQRSLLPPQQLSESIVQRDDLIPGVNDEDLANGTQPEEMLDGPNDPKSRDKRKRGEEDEQKNQKNKYEHKYERESKYQPLQPLEGTIQTKRESKQLVIGQKEDSIQSSENDQPNLWARISSPDKQVPFWGRTTTNSSENGSLTIQRVETRNKGVPPVNYTKMMAGGGGGGHPPVPKNAWQTKTVNATTYNFWNEADGTIEFTNPLSTGDGAMVPGPALVAKHTVNIHAGNAKMIHTGRTLINTRYQHFLAANIDYEGNNPPVSQGNSPPGLTWHHHKNKGVMQLIDRQVHAAFGHHGGFSIWGS